MAPVLFIPSLLGKLAYFIALSQPMFAKALLKTFSQVDTCCKSFYWSMYA